MKACPCIYDNPEQTLIFSQEKNVIAIGRTFQLPASHSDLKTIVILLDVLRLVSSGNLMTLQKSVAVGSGSNQFGLCLRYGLGSR